MSEENAVSAGELPPRPDRWSGHPRPPRAPGFVTWDKPLKEADSERDRSQRHRPSPPEGQGPVLEWYRHSQRYAIGMAVTGFIVIGIEVDFRQGFDFSWVYYWWIWLFLVVAGLGMYGIFRNVDPAAGADWLKVSRTWVSLYARRSRCGIVVRRCTWISRTAAVVASGCEWRSFRRIVICGTWSTTACCTRRYTMEHKPTGLYIRC